MTDLLKHLEAQAVEGIRDAFEDDKRVAVLVSDGLASDVLRYLIKKSVFPFSPAYTIVHIDEGSNFAELAEFVDRIREQERQEIEVKSLQKVVNDSNLTGQVETVHTLNACLRELVSEGDYSVVMTGLQWNREHPWLSHDLVFRSNQIHRVEPLGNWTRRDLENFAIHNIQGYVRPQVRVA